MAKIIAKSIDWNGEFTFDTSKPDGAEEKKSLGKIYRKELKLVTTNFIRKWDPFNSRMV